MDATTRNGTTAITERARNIPVAYDADVVVVGAGPGGFAAALQAARMGARTLVVERFDMPGGVHTSGLQGHAGQGVGGIHTELMERFAREGYIYTVTQDRLPNWAGNPLSHYERRHAPDAPFTRMSFNPEGAGSVMANMLQEAGVTALYGTSFVEAIVKEGIGDNRIEAIVVENASGRQAITGRIFIEGSGTAQLARHQRDAKDPVLARLIAEATAAGDIPPGLYRPRMEGTNVYGDLYIGHPTLDMSPMQADGTFIFWQNVPYEWALHMDESADDDARAKRALRFFIDAEVKFLKKYVPGFDQAFLTNVGRFVGIRDGRHPVGEYVYSIEDARQERRFRDAISKPMTKPFYWDSHAKYSYEVPFRAFLPKKIDNLILTGASMSFTYDTIFMVMRNFNWCTQTGEIAGFAAARCIDKKITAKELKWTEPYF